MLTQGREHDLMSRIRLMKSSPESGYQYKPLDPLKNEIRILHVCWAPFGTVPKWKRRLSQLMSVEDAPGTWKEGLKDVPRQSYDKGQSVQCWLETESLDFGPEYTALSYCWGTHGDMRKIVLNGCETYIRANLHWALLEIRQQCFDRGGTSIAIWADALCINQEDEKEKSYQVNMMQTIFARAQTTIAWLGAGFNEKGEAIDHSTAMTCLKRVGESARARGTGKAFNINVHDSLTDDDFECLAKQTVRELKLASDMRFGSRHSRILEALWAVTNLTWWHRVWVVQEIAVSKQVYLACGSFLVPWDTVDAAITVFKRILVYEDRMTSRVTMESSYISETDHQLLIGITSSASPFCEARRRFQSIGMHQSLRDILYLTCTVGSELIPMQATDQRDKIFALLGLATDAQALGITPNYGMEYAQLCTDVARAFMKQGTVDMLSYCRYFRSDLSKRSSIGAYRRSLPNITKPNLPSWVPDWASGVPETLQTDSIQFSASNGAKTKGVLAKVSTGSSTLRLSACFVDEIQTAFAPFPDSRDLNLQEIRAWLRKVQDEFQDLSYVGRDKYGLSTRRNRAIWKTTIADHGVEKDGSMQRGSADNYQAYRVLMGLEAPHNAFEDDEYKTRYPIESSIYKSALLKVMPGRKLFLTKTGYLGLGPKEFQLGDIVCIFLGSGTPHAIREATKDKFHLVGELYVHGIMDGEFMKTDPDIRSIKLV
ncbi:HET-domain-containing protein [Zopfia rhizophila CBS 207.26]|uniref:HET-domain-containing protein n=1 Tax=Zopfia rhizophila CBS 207.26 TaxID=1314779 RepID=A0A6A6DHI6_9PEZI|nr:HET-domain-containing protein [Zopfia rhizophila CBS 207.26]